MVELIGGGSVINGASDMEHVQNLTQAGLFVSRFYPKVRKVRQF